ncbi:hypothetical protein [uncultured Tateyamaria sp.]|uniref:hypothetical protein n=1 Tax=uncultured Tateyamaria sp. TaxID=455651 RepID=UPI002634C852|nr:hypothetical protein [uncultured Tateyamaria sp.]
MSDYPNPNLHRGDGVSGRGLLIAFALIVGVVAILALVGSIGGGSTGGTAGQDAIAPATEVAPATEGTVAPTE